jgi:hypothetical protein
MQGVFHGAFYKPSRGRLAASAAAHFAQNDSVELSYPSVVQRSPTIEGFRAMFRRPSFVLAEIAWRWSFRLAAALLLTFSFLEYLNTLPVSRGDVFLLRTGQPGLVSQALAHILHGSGPRLVKALIVLALGMAVAWIGIATLGRAVTVKALLNYLRQEGAGEPSGEKPWRLGPLAGLNFLRAAVTLAGAVGCATAWLLGAAASPDKDPSPGSAVLIFLTIVMLVYLAWSALNWFLSLAAVFVVRQGEDTFGAIAAAVALCRTRTGSVAAASIWFGLAHLVGFVIASSLVAFPLAFVAVLPAGVVLGGMLLVTLLYFALADFLYAGRLAAYVAIAEGGDASALAAIPLLPESNQPSVLSIQPDGAGIDPDELILSDITTP